MSACLSPFKKKDSNDSFPCGKCVNCKARRVSAWSFRLLKEAERSESAFFLTMTYDIEHVPLTKSLYMTLLKKDLQNFMKRLRNRPQFSKLKYYAVGEYGGKWKRPHYHLIIFNMNLSTLIGENMALAVRQGHIPLDGKHHFVSDIWNNGTVTVGTCEGASIGYCLKYISKNKRIPEHKNDDRLPEFSCMSKRLGDNYVTPEIIEWHRDDLLNRKYISLKNGLKISMPRYFNKFFYTELEREEINKHVVNQIDIKDSKKTLAQLKLDEYIRMGKGSKNDDTRIESDTL